MKLRPHHFYCVHFVSFFDHSRGGEFEEARGRIERLFRVEAENVEINEGPDPLCEACPHFNGQMCVHPNGDETAVRKWDARIINELGLEYGEVMKIAEMKSLIKEKAPLNFCMTRCRYYRGNRCNPLAPSTG